MSDASAADPFGTGLALDCRRDYRLLGVPFEFHSNSEALMALADAACRGLPEHRLAHAAQVPRRVELRLGPARTPAWLAADEPPAPCMHGGAGLRLAAVDEANLAAVQPAQGLAVVHVSPALLARPYHARHELIEFAVYVLAQAATGMLPLHAGALATADGDGLLLVGESGAGKSTLTLRAQQAGLHFLTEDSCFVHPQSLAMTGLSSWLHLRLDALRWIAEPALRERITASPVIRRRSGDEKYELDLRGGWARLAGEPPVLRQLVFASREPAGTGPLLLPLDGEQRLQRLRRTQPYAAGHAGWADFERACLRLPAWQLRRGAHPDEAAQALLQLLRK
jgi:hypothetical protein